MIYLGSQKAQIHNWNLAMTDLPFLVKTDQMVRLNTCGLFQASYTSIKLLFLFFKAVSKIRYKNWEEEQQKK